MRVQKQACFIGLFQCLEDCGTAVWDILTLISRVKGSIQSLINLTLTQPHAYLGEEKNHSLGNKRKVTVLLVCVQSLSSPFLISPVSDSMEL